MALSICYACQCAVPKPCNDKNECRRFDMTRWGRKPVSRDDARRKDKDNA